MSSFLVNNFCTLTLLECCGESVLTVKEMGAWSKCGKLIFSMPVEIKLQFVLKLDHKKVLKCHLGYFQN